MSVRTGRLNRLISSPLAWRLLGGGLLLYVMVKYGVLAGFLAVVIALCWDLEERFKDLRQRALPQDAPNPGNDGGAGGKDTE